MPLTFGSMRRVVSTTETTQVGCMHKADISIVCTLSNIATVIRQISSYTKLLIIIHKVYNYPYYD